MEASSGPTKDNSHAEIVPTMIALLSSRLRFGEPLGEDVGEVARILLSEGDWKPYHPTISLLLIQEDPEKAAVEILERKGWWEHVELLREEDWWRHVEVLAMIFHGALVSPGRVQAFLDLFKKVKAVDLPSPLDNLLAGVIVNLEKQR